MIRGLPGRAVLWRAGLSDKHQGAIVLSAGSAGNGYVGRPEPAGENEVMLGEPADCVTQAEPRRTFRPSLALR